MADVFGELSAGLLDGSNPLPEEYQTTSVDAIISRSPSTLENRASCITKVIDTMSCVGNHIEHEVMGSTSELSDT